MKPYQKKYLEKMKIAHYVSQSAEYDHHKNSMMDSSFHKTTLGDMIKEQKMRRNTIKKQKDKEARKAEKIAEFYNEVEKKLNQARKKMAQSQARSARASRHSQRKNNNFAEYQSITKEKATEKAKLENNISGMFDEMMRLGVPGKNVEDLMSRLETLKHN
jgi:chromosome segregation ATPase